MSQSDAEVKKSCRIAVTGIGCWYPGANTPLQLWENILSRRRQFREMPDVRLPNSEYFDPDPAVLNKTYQNKAAVIDGYAFDWAGKRIPKQTYESTDIVHWLALDTALQAITDSSYQKENIPKEKTGVILGNTLTGEFTRSNQMLLRWPYVQKALRVSARKKGLTHILNELEAAMENTYKSVFAPVTEDTLAGGLANTIAGRICNYLDIHGGGYIVDGACSSSLLAIITAANYLELGQMDMVIAGGVDVSLDTFELIGFAKTGALTPDEMRVYDKAGKGFLPGEGCGMVVLKRYEDAVRDHDHIYAIINGWGISSDGKGGITAPSAEGQSRALLRAYQKAGFDPHQLHFIEGHGTGTTVGDRVELEAISIALNHKETIPPRNCGVTSFKSIVGHTKAAAGIGAFIKAVMAVNRRVIPPTAGLKDPNPIFNDKAAGIYPVLDGEVRNVSDTLNAGISAMGFGGINSHVLIQSAHAPSEKLKPSLNEGKLLVSDQSHEIYLFSAGDKNELIKEIRNFAELAKGISYAEMADLAFDQNKKISFFQKSRAAVIADTPFELGRKLGLLIEALNAAQDDKSVILEKGTVAAGSGGENPAIGIVFPGQGSQKINMARKLSRRFDWAKDMIRDAGKLFESEGAGQVIPSMFRQTERAADTQQISQWQNELKQTNIAQPAITLASLLWYEYLLRLGISVQWVAGHSLGELMAFYAAGYLDKETLLKFAVFRGRSMASNGSGTMASLQCSQEKAAGLLAKATGYVTIANLNGPQQTVISGEENAVAQVVAAAKDADIGAIELPVSAAFHSSLVAEVGTEIEKLEILRKEAAVRKDIQLVSSVTGKHMSGSVDLNRYFAQQAISKVDFVSTARTLSEKCDMIIEAGPGKVLSGLISAIHPEMLCYPSEISDGDELSLQVLLAAAFIAGCSVNMDELYKDRLIRDFIPANKKAFLVNPLERPFSAEISDTPQSQPGYMEMLFHERTNDDQFAGYLKVRQNFIRELIDADYRYYNPLVAHDNPPVRSVTAVKVVPPEKAIAAEEGENDVKSLLYKKIEELTGFKAASFRDDMKLLDDFNLDSIKSGALLAGLAKTFGIAGKINTPSLSNASLAEIISGIEKVADKKSLQKKVSVDVVNQGKQVQDVAEVIFNMLSERTGFPATAIEPGFRLLDDLNLDSIKAGSFIGEISRKFGLQGKFTASQFANASVEDIILKVKDMLGEASDKQEGADYIQREKPGVQSYIVKIVEEPLQVDKNAISSFWKHKSLVIIYSNQDEKAATVLGQSMNPYVSKVVTVPDHHLHLLTSFENSCLLVMMPKDPVNKDTLQKTAALLSQVASHTADADLLGFVQFNDGCFLRNCEAGSHVKSGYSAVSFAASIHLERPTARIRVLEIERQLSSEEIPWLLLKEFTTERSFDTAAYDQSLTRHRMLYHQISPLSAPGSDMQFSESDVLIATGGAKGITAECVFAFAMKHRCKTALVGSSLQNEEITRTLKRFEKENLPVKYYCCDITNKEALEQTVEQIAADLGKITIVIHGAGRNIPRRSEQVSFEDAMNEIGPKIIGGIQLCQIFEKRDIRYYIALTSIIGVTGMPGNSWYAFSNENLDLYLRESASKFGFRVTTLAYSIWDEVGMGVRMGSNKVLADMGIDSIPPAQGVQQFIRWTENTAHDQQIVISSKLGGLDTWSVLKPALPDSKRFISEIQFFEPGRELITNVRLNRQTDLYLDHHNYNGSFLFPTVFGIEAMAQAAYVLSGEKKIKDMVFENVSLQKPIVVPAAGDLEVRIKATIIDTENPKRIYTGISTEHSAFSSFHFSAEILINSGNEPEMADIDLPASALKINPVNDLYSWLLFQGPKFQQIDRVYELKADSVTFSTLPPIENIAGACFSSAYESSLLAGSPFLRDVLLQSVQMFLTSKKYLPVSISKWQIFTGTENLSRGIVHSKLRELSKETGICDVDYIINNQVVEHIEGYEVKALEQTPTYPDPLTLASLDNLYTQKIRKDLARYDSWLQNPLIYAVYKHDDDFSITDKDTRLEIENRVYREMITQIPDNAGLINSVISRAANGKPVIQNSDLKVSIAHSRSVLMMTAGMNEQGCDIEFVANRTKQEWDDLLDNKFLKTIEQLTNIDEDFNISATRLWCVRESLIKSIGAVPLGIVPEKIQDTGVLFRVKTSDQDNLHVVTIPVTVLPGNTLMIAFIAELKPDEKIVPSKSPLVRTNCFNSEINGFSHHFITTFKDCKGFSGKTHFTNFPDWMGTLRELVLAPIGHELLKDLGTGNFGMVTNTSEVLVLNEADTLDLITGNLWITDKSDLKESTIDLNFEFIRNHPSTSQQVTIARCNLSTTWVSIEARGIVKKSPIPGYFIDFLNHYQLKNSLNRKNLNGIPFPHPDESGKLIYENTNAVRPKVLLSQKEFQTGLSNGNTVGNLYYSNYYHWQSKIIEQYLYHLVPDIMLGNGRNGEFLTLETNVKHLQEAMPFESILVNMYLEKVHENGLKFYFEYFSKNQTDKRKLAYGSNTLIFAMRNDEKSTPAVHKVPAIVSNALLSATTV